MIWLHIGTTKTGTTALQHHLSSNRDALAEQGLTYVSPAGKTSSNSLAVAMNKNRADALQELRADLSGQIAGRKTKDAILSSEMLFGIAPDRLVDAIPALAGEPLSVLVYLRRQDRYLESNYLQKLKNGRFRGSIHEHIARFKGSGANYWETLKPWRDHTSAATARVTESVWLILRTRW